MKKIFNVSGLDCAVCAGKVEAEIKKISGVISAELNFATAKLYLEYGDTANFNELYAAISRISRAIEPEIAFADTQAELKQADELKKSIFNHSNLVRLIGAVLFLPALVLSILFETGILTPPLTGLAWDITEASYFTLCLGLIAFSVIYKFFVNLFKLRVFDENFLMMLAAIGAFALGEYPEGVAIMLFYQVGEFFQRLAVARSRASIRNLVSSKAEYVTLVDEAGATLTAPQNAKIGDKMLIRAGEKIALDGVVIEGRTSVDTSMLTGEALPVAVGAGDEVLSGSVNLHNPITAGVTRNYSESTASKILEMVENAANKKAKSEQFITKFSKFYTPAMVLLAVGLAVIPPLFTGEWEYWIHIALTALIISCPCALVLSIPICYFGGVGAASRRGILFKGANYLEALAKPQNVVFDKTGTLTEGVFSVRQLCLAEGVSAETLLYYAAHAESMSPHPLSRAVLNYANIKTDASVISRHTELVGLGISAEIAGKAVFCGSRELLENNGIAVDAFSIPASATAIYVAAGGKLLGALALSDRVKEGAREAVGELKALGVQKTVMLTGDNQSVAEAVQVETGIDEVYAKCLPEHKMDIIAEYCKSGKTVFAGEGINDILALSAADVGISMGALGADVATEAADVVLMTDEIGKIPAAVKIARRTRLLVGINICVVMAVKALMLILAAFFNEIAIILAEIADVGVALIAVFVARTILTYNPEAERETTAHAHG